MEDIKLTEEDEEMFNEASARGILYSFIPGRLEVGGRPELNNFPRNVLFMHFKDENGKRISGSALYNPILDSYVGDGGSFSMEYYNSYGGNHRLIIKYNDLNYYHAEKYVNGKMVGAARGKILDDVDWKTFFIHFTMLGLANGEKCKFETVDQSSQLPNSLFPNT